MQFLFYGGSGGSDENRLEAAILAAAPGHKIERFTSLADFRERMHGFVEPDSIAVLAAASGEELRQIHEFRELLKDVCIILVLPDWSKNTIKLAHLLQPRFFCLIEDDFSSLNQIVGKITRASN